MVSPEIFSSEPSNERLTPHGLLVLITGPTGVGKDTVLNNLKIPHQRIITYTSREQGLHEQEGVDYHFVTKEKFEAMLANDDFFEHDRDSRGIYYGTTKAELEEKRNSGLTIWRLNPRGVFKLLDGENGKDYKKALEPFVIIGLLADLPVLSERLMKRGREKGYVVVDRTKQAFVESESLKEKFVVAGSEKLFFYNTHSWTDTPLLFPKMRIAVRLIENREGLQNPRGLPRTMKLVQQTIDKLTRLWRL